MEQIRQAYYVMRHCTWHTFIVLTKRPDRLREYYAQATDGDTGAYNIVIGTTWGSNESTWRVRELCEVVTLQRKWISMEPLLAPLRLPSYYTDFGISGIGVGGESGPGARAAHPQWIRDLRDDANKHGIKFFFKQWGEWCAADQAENFQPLYMGVHPWPDDYQAVYPIKKRDAGRKLDGKFHNDLPW